MSDFNWNPSPLDVEFFAKDVNWHEVEPAQLPVTILDMERATGCLDMMLPMADGCPACGATRMLVGDYACYGVCNVCAADRDD